MNDLVDKILEYVGFLDSNNTKLIEEEWKFLENYTNIQKLLDSVENIRKKEDLRYSLIKCINFGLRDTERYYLNVIKKKLEDGLIIENLTRYRSDDCNCEFNGNINCAYCWHL